MPRYDVAVVGAGLAGLSVAALLSRRRKNVIILDPGKEVGGALAIAEHRGFRFSTGSTLSFGFERGGVLEAVYSELGIAHSASVLSPCYQVLLPNHRINIYAESSETREELRREFPREFDAVVAFFRDLRTIAERMARGGLSAFFYRRRRARGFIGKYRFSRELTAFFDVQSLFFLRLPVADLSLAALAALFDAVPLSIHGGLRKLADQMLNVFLSSGGEIRYNVPWPELSTSHGRFDGLMTSSGPIEAGAMVYNVETNRRGSTLFIGIRDAVVPVGMSREMICLPDYERSGEFFTLSLSAPDDEASAPKGMRALTAFFPTVQRSSDSKQRLLERVGGVIPFLSQHVIVTEEHNPAPREYRFPSSLSFKPVRFEGGQSLLLRTSAPNVYLIHDGRESPVRMVHAAKLFAERLK